MDMTSVLERLKSLQDVLVQKYDLKARVTESPEQVALQQQMLDADRRDFIDKNARFEEERDKVTKLHVELETAMRVRESGEKNMDDITTHREYEALDKQISEATLREKDLRKDLQVEEKILADLSESMKMSEQSIKAQEEQLRLVQSEHDQKMAEYKATLAELETKEKEESEGVDNEVLFKFQRIIQRHSDGIVAVRGGVCTGCSMILPMQFALEVRRGDDIMFCPYCSRILFYEEADENAEDQYSIGSLAYLDEEGADDKSGDEDDGARGDEDDDDEDGEGRDDRDEDGEYETERGGNEEG